MEQHRGRHPLQHLSPHLRRSCAPASHSRPLTATAWASLRHHAVLPIQRGPAGGVSCTCQPACCLPGTLVGYSCMLSIPLMNLPDAAAGKTSRLCCRRLLGTKDSNLAHHWGVHHIAAVHTLVLCVRSRIQTRKGLPSQGGTVRSRWGLPAMVHDGILAKVCHSHLQEQVGAFRVLPEVHIRHL